MSDDPVTVALMVHLEVNEAGAEIWADYIAKLTFGNDPAIFDLKRDLEGLENLERALTALIAALQPEAMTQAASDALGFRMIWGPHADELRKRSGEPIETFDPDMLSYPERVGKKAAYSLSALEQSATTIRAAVLATKREINTSTRARKGTGRINFRGIQLVNSARDVWRLSTAKEAPARSLNPASRFGKFLCDLFDAFEIEGDPRAAFRAWVALQ